MCSLDGRIYQSFHYAEFLQDCQPVILIETKIYSSYSELHKQYVYEMRCLLDLLHSKGPWVLLFLINLRRKSLQALPDFPDGL